MTTAWFQPSARQNVKIPRSTDRAMAARRDRMAHLMRDRRAAVAMAVRIACPYAPGREWWREIGMLATTAAKQRKESA